MELRKIKGYGDGERQYLKSRRRKTEKEYQEIRFGARIMNSNFAMKKKLFCDSNDDAGQLTH